jgi:hypothetical protein
MRSNEIMKSVRGNDMRYLRLLVGSAFILLTVMAFMSCSGGSSTPTGISQAEAITIAKDKVVADAVMTLADRDEIVVDEGTVWHVSFPFTASLDMVGGEPHVKISKADGTIVSTYYTQ